MGRRAVGGYVGAFGNMPKALRLCLLLVLAALASCSATRNVPRGEYLLSKVKLQPDRDHPRKERVGVDDMEKYIRQGPNTRFLGMKVSLAVYNMARPGSEAWLSRLLRRMGSPPVILDSALALRSATNIRNYLDYRGYLGSEVTFVVDTARRKAKVTYFVSQHKPYTIDSVACNFLDKAIRSAVMEDSARSLIVPGRRLDFDALDNERKRIAGNLKNKGYYNFTAGSIFFDVDTTAGDRRAGVTMVVKQYQDGFDASGRPVMGSHPLYRIRNINLNPSFDPARAASDSLYSRGLDSTNYFGLNILYKKRFEVKPRIMRKYVMLHSDSLYNDDEVNQTYNRIMRLGYFRSMNILFDPVAGAGAGHERQLDCYIRCTPGKKHSYKVDFEGSTTSSFNSVTIGLGYQNRNLFRGVELFDLNFKTGLEFMKAGSGLSYDVGASVSLTFPRFLLPIDIDRHNRVPNPRTRFEVSIDEQKKPVYRRTLSSGSLGYSWLNRRGNITYVVRPVDVNLIKVGYVDDGFLNSLGNSYLQDSYRSQLVAGISSSMVYSNTPATSNLDNVTVRLNLETNGNLLRAISPMFSGRNVNGRYEVFGIEYAQYVLGNISMSNRFALGSRTSIAYRLWGGYGFTYGNSFGGSIPNERLFYAGGSNSMRGWQVRTLGPGATDASTVDRRYPSQVGDIKLEANVEFRFPVVAFLKGALFVDAGNVWLGRHSGGSPEATFNIGSFYRQAGLDVGLGARFDFNFFLLRLDWGVKLHDPGRMEGRRWIDKFRYSDTALTFGVGYPF
ncbi:MAG: BamA/TamA family outer membrane protein [Rikenellaceae bacterium]|jgi:outer membrane protein assembly factor BamA|nr:BamA/TamA family outer membrane protein [Rikenellaceae bacterium]